MTTSLLAGLVDDAGLFPPTALTMPDAVRRHRADQDAGNGVLAHRFLCPASRLGELRAELTADDDIAVGLIADTGVDGLAAALGELEQDERLRLSLLEFPLAMTGRTEPNDAVDAVLSAAADVPHDVAFFLEPAALADVDGVCDALSGHGAGRTVGLKARCGGVRAELFPSVDALAHFVVTVVAAGLPMKATAGLHHAVRYTDPDTGFTHHGFLNLVVAVADAVAGADAAQVAATLQVDDAGELARRAAELDADGVQATRGVLTSYGSCSTRVPVDEAEALGLGVD